jgi:threonine/homoserine/homoserine lactone efflux protein
MSIENFWLFAMATLMLNITPGNDMLYVIARSSGQGTKAGIVSALGIMGGCMVHTAAAVVGLSAVLTESALAFDIIKYAGAAYLVYLGVRSLLNKKKNIQVSSSTQKLTYRKLFWQGVFTNVLNPKVALFFLAFLPQFVNPEYYNVKGQILFLGIWFNISGTLINTLVALLFGKIGNWLNRSPKFVQWQERLTGLFLIALGIRVALSSGKRINV